MMAFYINDQPYLAQNRVNNLAMPELVVCSLCDGISWLPVACQYCERPYCSACIKVWQSQTSTSALCPPDCTGFSQRLCPPAIMHILNKLQVTCRYKLYGCIETLSYSELEAHEAGCGYQLITCSGCDERIVKKDFHEHHSTCPLVLLTCAECHSVYQRRVADEHTELKCLRIQLHQLRDQIQQNQQEHQNKFCTLESQLNDLQDIIRQISV